MCNPSTNSANAPQPPPRPVVGRAAAWDLVIADAKAAGIAPRVIEDMAERHAIDMPITAEMYRVLHEGESPRAALQRLMTRSLKSEVAR